MSIRDNVAVDGSLVDGGQAFAGYFAVEASDLDHAVWIGRMIPVADGWAVAGRRGDGRDFAPMAGGTRARVARPACL